MLLLAGVAQAATKPLTVEVGQRKRFPIEAAQGLILTSPRIAEVELVGGRMVEVLGKSAGKTELEVWTPAGKSVSYVVEVRSGKAPPKPEPTPFEVEWTEPVFGGRRLENARCELPFKDPRAGELFEKARAELARGDTSSAIVKLEEVLRLEPEAATAHLFLGAALAKMEQADRGVASFETFALSCSDDPRYPWVVNILRKYHQRIRGSLRDVPKPPVAARTRRR